jgi:prevent-host-death family protein
MSRHSVAEARNRLSELIDRALRGEGVVITRHGHPVVELRAVRPPARPMTAADLDWIAARRVGKRRPDENAGELLQRLRDEDER